MIVKEKDQLEVEIMDMNHRGQGVAKADGYVIFIDDLIIGDVACIEIESAKKQYAVGKVVRLLKASPYRVKPECPYFWDCGGCQLMHMRYDQQLIVKKQRVKSEINKFIPTDQIVINDTLGMESPFRYRNKGAYPVVMEKGQVAIGAYRIGTHEIVDLDACLIQHPVADGIVNTFRAIITATKLMPYDEKNGTGLIKHLMIRTNIKNEAMVIIVAAKNKLPYKNEIIHKLLDEIPEIKSIYLNTNHKQTNVVLGDKNKKLYGEAVLTDQTCDLDFSISPHSFFQVNHTQTEVLYQKAIEFAGLNKNQIVYDIYCGIGTISLVAARQAKKVYGIKMVQAAIEDARENAKANQIHNVEFYCGKAETIFPQIEQDLGSEKVVIVDPPRKGCDKSVLDTIIRVQPIRVVYVSCNPATLARDLKILVEGGYAVKEIQPVDMFPHSSHVETVVLITRNI